MELVRKKGKRGQYVLKLTLSEKVLFLHVFSTGRKSSLVDICQANNILDEMDKQKLWIKCDCVEPIQNEEGPFNCEVNAANLRHVSKSRSHDKHCAFYRLKKEIDADNTVNKGKTSPLYPVAARQKKENQIITVDGPAVPRKRRRKTPKQILALGRKLLTLIQAAGLNQLELIP